MVYRWKELELFSIQTLSNIITFIQFALAPLELISPESKSSEKDLILIMNKRFSSIIKFFSSPLNLIKKYNSIIGPIRTMLSSLIFNAFIIFLYTIFFLPSWRFIIFFLDVFIPGCFLFGIVFISRKYDEKFKISILLIIGLIYFLIRITFLILSIIKHKKIKWYVNCANRISSVFLSRLKKNHECHDEITEDIRYQIDKNTTFIQFDEFHFPYKKRIIDFVITFLIWIFLLIFVIFGWKKIIQKNYKGKQLDDISLILDMITCALFFGMCIRLMINVIWLIKPIEKKIFKIFKILHKLAYKGIHFLAGVSLIPILGIALKSTTGFSDECGQFYFYDEKSNPDSFITYFTIRDDSFCKKCTIPSIEMDKSCYNACSVNLSKPIYLFYFTKDFLSLSSFQDLYLTQILIFDVFYLSFFIFWIRSVSKMAYEVLVVLPAPTENVECKFQTLINTLDSAPLNVFRSYKYQNALYSFSFSEAKLFVYFWTNFLFCGFLPIPYEYDAMILCFIVSFASFLIGESQLFTSPYISALHNIVNFFSYTVSGISSLLVGFHVCYLFRMPQQLSIFLVIIIVISPILTAVITPFFVKKDPLLLPTKFDLSKIQKWDKKLNQIIDFRRRQSKAKKKKKEEKNKGFSEDEDDIHFNNDGILFADEPSFSFSNIQNNEDQRENDFFVGNFELLKLAPIQVQERLNKMKQQKDLNDDKNKEEFIQNVEKLWPKIDINDCFDKAAKEMIHSSTKLIDCICYKNLIGLFNFSLIFASACLGWCLSSGIERWQKILSPQGFQYYLRCNMFVNGSFPAFDTY